MEQSTLFYESREELCDLCKVFKKKYIPSHCRSIQQPAGRRKKSDRSGAGAGGPRYPFGAFAQYDCGEYKHGRNERVPDLQDTGMPTFIIHCPVGANQIAMKKDILSAIRQATLEGKLRSNSVDSLTGANSGDNLGPGTPVIHFEQWENDDIEIKLILKGGGCENKKNIQYSLPAELPGLGKAGRDLDGIRKCILHAVYQAQGQGCSAGFIGVGIGGDRTTGYELAKHQLFRKVDDVNENGQLRELEDYIMENANKLGSERWDSADRLRFWDAKSE